MSTVTSRSGRSSGLATRSVRLERIMGCRAGLTVTAPGGRVSGLVTWAVDRLHHLESCWSRFLPDSDISRLNRSPGRPVVVDPSTITLLTAMAAGARTTAGAFDPTVLVAMVGLGYAPPWSAAIGGGAVAGERDRLRWIDETRIDVDSDTVVPADGAQLDPGAIGKGLAADLVAAQLVAGGATAARVAVGGDVRVTAPSVVGVNGPDGRPLDRIVLAGGGVATSGMSRRWVAPTGDRVHHVLDPVTRRPLERSADRDVVQVTVAAATAVDAEVHATAVLVDPGADRLDALDQLSVGVLALDRRGVAYGNEAWHRLRQPTDDMAGAL